MRMERIVTTIKVQLIFLFIPLCIAGHCSLVHAGILQVGPLGDGYVYTTIQSAIEDASDDDTVLVSEGVYCENIDFLGKAITVKSTMGAHTTHIDGTGSGSVVTFAAQEDGPIFYGAVLEGFTIMNGKSTCGGGIYCFKSSPKIVKNIIMNNSAMNDDGIGFGGGIFCNYYSSPLIINNEIRENSALTCGGGIYCYNNSCAILVNNTISNNSAISFDSSIDTFGGGVFSQFASFLILNTNTITENYANYGSAICAHKSSLTISNSIIWANEGNELYGLEGSSISYCLIQGIDPASNHNNISADPKFLDPENGDYHLSSESPCIDKGDSTALYLPSTDLDGVERKLNGEPDIGAYEYANTLEVGENHRYSTIQEAIDKALQGDTILVYPGEYRENISFKGKAITVRAVEGTKKTFIISPEFLPAVRFTSGEKEDSVLEGFTIKESESNFGGAIWCASSSPTIKKNCIIHNRAEIGGALFCQSSSPTIMENVIRANSSTNGGAIFLSKSFPLIINNIIRDNIADETGGAFNISDSAPFLANNCIFNNSAQNGSCLFAEASSPVMVNNTIVGNFAEKGHALFFINCEPALHNTILWMNGKEFQGVDPEVVHHCTIGSGDYRYADINDNIKGDPLFVDEENNDYRLDPSSPCIDTGEKNAPFLPLVDIERKNRTINELPDMGAYEYVDRAIIGDTPIHDTVGVDIQDMDDLIQPVITVDEEKTIEIPYGESGIAFSEIEINVVATDDNDPEPLLINDAPSYLPLGDTLITFSAIDDFGNSATTIVKITVKLEPDTTPPVMTHPADQVIEIECGEEEGVPHARLDLSASAYDDRDLTIEPTNNAPSWFPVGDTVVTFIAVDSAGNSTSKTITITVVEVDTTPPELEIPDNQVIEITSGTAGGVPRGDVNLSAHAYDACDQEVKIIHNAPEVFPSGDTIVTFTARDKAGNTTHQLLTISVKITATQEPPVSPSEKQSAPDWTPVWTQNWRWNFLPFESNYRYSLPLWWQRNLSDYYMWSEWILNK
ncbi:MAG: choice-of-anchor Q domain-containing protein [bacterium]